MGDGEPPRGFGSSRTRLMRATWCRSGRWPLLGFHDELLPKEGPTPFCDSGSCFGTVGSDLALANTRDQQENGNFSVEIPKCK